MKIKPIPILVALMTTASYAGYFDIETSSSDATDTTIEALVKSNAETRKYVTQTSSTSSNVVTSDAEEVVPLDMANVAGQLRVICNKDTTTKTKLGIEYRACPQGQTGRLTYNIVGTNSWSTTGNYCYLARKYEHVSTDCQADKYGTITYKSSSSSTSGESDRGGR